MAIRVYSTSSSGRYGDLTNYGGTRAFVVIRHLRHQSKATQSVTHNLDCCHLKSLHRLCRNQLNFEGEK